MNVSVVIPAFNAEATLGETLASVAAQTHAPAEVIVVDDGSTDATAAVAADVEVVRTDNRGVAAARNLGLLRATGDLVAFLDADDVWAPEKLERQVAVLDAGVGLSFTGLRRVGSHGELLGEWRAVQYPDFTEALLLHSNVVPISSTVVRRSIAVEFAPELSQSADWDFALRMSVRTRFAAVDAPLVSYRVHGANMSRNIALLEADTRRTLARFFASAPPEYARLRRRAEALNWMAASGSYFHAGDRRAALRCALRGAATDPLVAHYPLTMPLRRLRNR